ncbi:hypothetical protein [Nonomuraea fuscirosea]|uniref:hypothetical protein n=1 Tax=Nonomuraea fuscirosea TaxID=1291556 RepID=UPI00343F202B
MADLLLAPAAHNVIEVRLAGEPVARDHAREPLSAAILDAAWLVVLMDNLRTLPSTAES